MDQQGGCYEDPHLLHEVYGLTGEYVPAHSGERFNSSLDWRSRILLAPNSTGILI